MVKKVKNKPKKKLKISVQIVVTVLSTALFFVMCGVAISDSVSFGHSMYTISYSQIANTDYKVYLKENNHYVEDFLGPGYEYPATLIDDILIDFDYLMMSEREVLNFDYNYTVSSRLVITNRNEANKILSDETKILVEESHNISSAVVSIDEAIDIDYDYYNEIVNDYKTDLSIPVASNLIVTLNISVNGTSENVEDTVKEIITRSVIIPLNEQTIGIELDNSKIVEKGQISDLAKSRITDMSLFVRAVIFCIAGIVFTFIAINNFNKYFKSRDAYKVKIKKYLREYDRLIVTSKETRIDEETFSNIIAVMTMEELIDAHDSTGQPIVYYEMVEDEESHFVIVSGSILYRYILTRNSFKKN